MKKRTKSFNLKGLRVIIRRSDFNQHGATIGSGGTLYDYIANQFKINPTIDDDIEIIITKAEIV